MDNREEILALMPPRDSYPRMLFSNDDNYWIEGILESVYDGHYIKVDAFDEEAFLNGRDFETLHYSHCKPIPTLSTEPWTDRLKIMNWCHKQEECVVVSYEGNEVNAWSRSGFCCDLKDYEWNKIHPETNELMYKENKTFCNFHCLEVE